MAVKKEAVKEESKKKLFVSVPMKGRTEENIKRSITRMHKMAEIMLDEEFELIDSYIEDKPPKDSKEAVWFLGESIKKLSEADVMIGLAEIESFNGCMVEREVALLYGIPYIRVLAEQVAVDLLRVDEESVELPDDFNIAPLE